MGEGPRSLAHCFPYSSILVEFACLHAGDERFPFVVGIELGSAVWVLAVTNRDTLGLSGDLNAGLWIVLGPRRFHEVFVHNGKIAGTGLFWHKYSSMLVNKSPNELFYPLYKQFRIKLSTDLKETYSYKFLRSHTTSTHL